MNNEKTQTAVEILFHKLWDTPKDKFTWYALLNEAQAMEKEQHEETWENSRLEDKGDNYIGRQKLFKEYYNETYGGNK